MRLFGMTIQQRMGFIKASSFIVLVVLLCTLAAVSSEERNNDEEVFLRQLVVRAPGEIDEDLHNYNTVLCSYCMIMTVEVMSDETIIWNKLTR